MFTEDVQQETQLGTWTTASSQKKTLLSCKGIHFLKHHVNLFLMNLEYSNCLALRVINYQEYFQKPAWKAWGCEICLPLFIFAHLWLPLVTFPGLQGLTRPYWAPLGLTYWASLGLTGPYWALLGLTGWLYWMYVFNGSFGPISWIGWFAKLALLANKVVLLTMLALLAKWLYSLLWLHWLDGLFWLNGSIGCFGSHSWFGWMVQLNRHWAPKRS